MTDESRLIDITVNDLKALISEITKETIREELKREQESKTMGGDDLLKGAEELAQYLRIGTQKAFRMIRSRQLDAALVQLGPRTNYFSKKKLDEILKSNVK